MYADAAVAVADAADRYALMMVVLFLYVNVAHFYQIVT
jgi:hypothetical protein